jgi:hypothetical protein
MPYAIQRQSDQLWFHGRQNCWGSALDRAIYHDVVNLPKSVSAKTSLDIKQTDTETVIIYQRVNAARDLYATVREINTGRKGGGMTI